MAAPEPLTILTFASSNYLHWLAHLHRNVQHLRLRATRPLVVCSSDGATLADAERKGLGTIDVRNGSGCEDALDPQTRLLCSRLVREKNATPSQHSNLHHLEESNWKAMGRKGPRRVAPGATGPTGETWGTPACTPLPASMTATPLGPRANAHDTCLWPCDERQIPTSCTPSRYA